MKQERFYLVTVLGLFLYIFFYIVGYICLGFTVISLFRRSFVGVLVFGIPALISYGVVSYLKKIDTGGSIDILQSKFNRDLLEKFDGNKKIIMKYVIIMTLTVLSWFVIYLFLR